MMMNGGNGDGGRVELGRFGGQQLIHGREDGNRVLAAASAARAASGSTAATKSDALPCRLQLAIDAEMVRAKGAGSGNGNAHNGFAGYFAASVSGPLPSTALRQRL